MSFTDKTLSCRDCGADFTFTAGEQEFYAEKGFTNEPSRCPSCRSQRKANGGGRRGMGGARQMYSAVCSSCGKTAQVPFEPRGDKPVYCSDCFQSQRSNRW
ncbi:MAG TPA: zinc-ribbon domain containing protein [Armatimonadota bacterium]|nr:zinc-ribbon domain containing protein [Armatimonadota bacterium]